MSQFEIQDQCQSEWCWAAVAASVFRYFYPEKPLGQSQIASKFLNLNCGCAGSASDIGCNTGADLRAVLGTCGKLCGSSLAVTIAAAGTVTFDRIRKEIDAGFPVCARVQWFGNSHHAHFVIIVGYALFTSGEMWLDIADPLKEASMLVPLPTFQLHYQGAGQWRQSYLLRKE